jgi:hypothetical protein
MTADCLEPLYNYMYRGLVAGGYIEPVPRFPIFRIGGG